MDTVLLCVVAVVLTVAWLAGQTVDIEPVDPELCFKACTVEPGKTPAWVNTKLFANHNLQFYDWSRLEPTQWHRLRGAIDDYYSIAPPPTTAAARATIDDSILQLAVRHPTDREASIRVLLLMVYHPDIYNKYDRYAAYTKKVAELTSKTKI